MARTSESVGHRAEVGVRTLRTDRWRLQPAVTFSLLSAFVIYGLYVTFANRNYFSEPYLSPFFSPCLTETCPASVRWLSLPLGPIPPALIVLVFPLGFRGTCYYWVNARPTTGHFGFRHRGVPWPSRTSATPARRVFP